MFVDEVIVLFCGKKSSSCMSGDARNVGGHWKYGHAAIFGCGGIVLLSLIARRSLASSYGEDNKKELINIFKYVIKVPCKCMKSAMWRHTSHVQKESTLVEILSTVENA